MGWVEGEEKGGISSVKRHLADGGDRTSARDGRDSHRHDGHVLNGGEVLLRMDWG